MIDRGERGGRSEGGREREGERGEGEGEGGEGEGEGEGGWITVTDNFGLMSGYR